MTSSRLSPSIGPDHDFPSLGISVDHPPHLPDDRLGPLLRDTQNPRRIERRCRPAVINSDRLPHTFIISLRPNPRDSRLSCAPEFPIGKVRGIPPFAKCAKDGAPGPIPLGIWQRHDREGHDFSRATGPKKWNRAAADTMADSNQRRPFFFFFLFFLPCPLFAARCFALARRCFSFCLAFSRR
jgi:hypothetical protein